MKTDNLLSLKRRKKCINAFLVFVVVDQWLHMVRDTCRDTCYVQQSEGIGDVMFLLTVVITERVGFFPDRNIVIADADFAEPESHECRDAEVLFTVDDEIVVFFTKE